MVLQMLQNIGVVCPHWDKCVIVLEKQETICFCFLGLMLTAWSIQLGIPFWYRVSHNIWKRKVNRFELQLCALHACCVCLLIFCDEIPWHHMHMIQLDWQIDFNHDIYAYLSRFICGKIMCVVNAKLIVVKIVNQFNIILTLIILSVCFDRVTQNFK